jgi:hypothetical protein
MQVSGDLDTEVAMKKEQLPVSLLLEILDVNSLDMIFF